MRKPKIPKLEVVHDDSDQWPPCAGGTLKCPGAGTGKCNWKKAACAVNVEVSHV
jgi:hypothetical protein